MNTKSFAFVLLTLAFSCMQTFALDIRDEGQLAKIGERLPARII